MTHDTVNLPMYTAIDDRFNVRPISEHNTNQSCFEFYYFIRLEGAKIASELIAAAISYTLLPVRAGAN